MTQIILNIENESILIQLKKIIQSLEGVTIVKPANNRKSGIEEAYEDVRAGRVSHYASAQDFFNSIGI